MEIWFYYVPMTSVELAIENKLALISQRSSCLCLSNIGTTCISHHTTLWNVILLPVKFFHVITFVKEISPAKIMSVIVDGLPVSPLILKFSYPTKYCLRIVFIKE